MRVGFVGLGKLGLPVALALEQAGHTVMGWDAVADRRYAIEQRNAPEAGHEPMLAEYLDTSLLPNSLIPVPELCEWAEIILVCVQTPHEPRFEGCTPLEDDPQDFGYSYLMEAVREIASCGTDALVVVVSTCLPGTFDRYVRPLAGGLRMAYHPLFIAMGSVIKDYYTPEFILIGSDGQDAPSEMGALYRGHWGFATVRHMSIASAELTKVAYNAAIGFKLLLANTVAELCDKAGADCDDVMGTLRIAHDRIVSAAYLHPGMGDGGGCHPRDQIALSWLAGEVGLSHDPFGYIIGARELHAEWLADLWWATAQDASLPPIMLGAEYKPNTPLKTGSHALLVAHYIADRYPVRVLSQPADIWPVACYFVACAHDWVLALELPAGSVVVDPWGLFPEREGVRVVRPGRRARVHHPAGPGVDAAAASRVAGAGGA